MCLSIPHKVISVKGTLAKVQCGAKKHTLDVRLLPKIKVGDYVLNENKFAVCQVPKKEAKETLRLLLKQ